MRHLIEQTSSPPVGRRRQEDHGGGRDGRGSGGGGDAADDNGLRRQRKHRQPEPGGGTETHAGERVRRSEMALAEVQFTVGELTLKEAVVRECPCIADRYNGCCL